MRHNTRMFSRLIRLLLLGMLSLFLQGCAQQPVRVAAPTTDLQLLQLGVNALTEPRQVAGPIQHPDQAANNGQLMGVAADLDDLHWLDEKDKARVRTFVTQAVVLIGQARAVPCHWWVLGCKRRNRAALAPLLAPQGPASAPLPGGLPGNRPPP